MLRSTWKGFTLVEAMMALVVLGLAVAAILTPITAAVDQKDRAAKQMVAVLLAEQTIEECLSRTVWCSNDPIVLGHDAGKTTRAAYNEKSDYHNLNESASQLGTVYGSALAASTFPNLKRKTWMQTLYLSGEYTGYSPDFVMLTVRVYDGDEELVTLRRLINNNDHTLP